ncbi:MAG: preprotein translocase subunit YajC [Tannerella sp.]|jgi:preprotein translocase subunit YajC|nr:preprotein translocase subunit YajC [Tannerella sp.]
MDLLNMVTLQVAAAQNQSFWEKYNGIVMLIAIVAIFYFLMIRPQQKRQKDIQKAREAMKAGDKVVTAGGIHGKIKEIADTTILIEVAEGVRIRVDKASVYASSEDVQSK